MTAGPSSTAVGTTRGGPIHELHDTGSGLPMLVFAGRDRSAAEIAAAVAAHDDGYHLGSQIRVDRGRWGWSTRFKNCENHDGGWPCDQSGEWHRHYSTNYPREDVTVVTVYPPTWTPTKRDGEIWLSIADPVGPQS